jgi:hypothetical protein
MTFQVLQHPVEGGLEIQGAGESLADLDQRGELPNFCRLFIHPDTQFYNYVNLHFSNGHNCKAAVYAILRLIQAPKFSRGATSGTWGTGKQTAPVLGPVNCKDFTGL